MPRVIDFKKKAEELRSILEKYNGLPTFKEDRVAYANVCYYIKNHSDEYESSITLGRKGWVAPFYLDYYFNGKWLPIETGEPTNTIGYKRLLRFQTVKADKLRIRFKVFKGTLCINKVGAFLVQ